MMMILILNNQVAIAVAAIYSLNSFYIHARSLIFGEMSKQLLE